MISFKEFIRLTEEETVSSSKRKGLMHLTMMKPVDFIEWIDHVKKDAKGLIDSRIPAVLKVDGGNLKFGKDKNGKVFIEGARTGPIFEPGSFSAHVKNNPKPATTTTTTKNDHDVILRRAMHYDDILKLFKENKRVTSSIMNVIPNDTKIDCEILYSPMASMEDDTSIQFITIKYDKKKLGSLCTILPYSISIASSGQKHPEEEKIKKELFSASSEMIKVIDPRLSYSGSIDINGIISPLESLLKNKKDTLNILVSRKKIDKEKKANLIQLIQKIKEDLANHVMASSNVFCGKDKLCDFNKGEGLVLHLDGNSNNISSKSFGSIKIINPEFELAHHGKVASRSS